MSDRTAQGRWRRAAAGCLAVAGALGISLASASWLDLPWTGSGLQQGAVRATTGCQDGQQIVVSYGPPQASGSGALPWRAGSVEFAGVADACFGRGYEVAYSTDDAASWTTLGPAGVVTGTSVSVSLAGVGDPGAITGWAMTIY